jgi:formamidase
MRGLTYQLAYTLCGVGVDLRISQTVDVPNLLASALLPPDSYV